MKNSFCAMGGVVFVGIIFVVALIETGAVVISAFTFLGCNATGCAAGDFAVTGTATAAGRADDRIRTGFGFAAALAVAETEGAGALLLTALTTGALAAATFGTDAFTPTAVTPAAFTGAAFTDAVFAGAPTPETFAATLATGGTIDAFRDGLAAGNFAAGATGVFGLPLPSPAMRRGPLCCANRLGTERHPVRLYAAAQNSFDCIQVKDILCSAAKSDFGS